MIAVWKRPVERAIGPVARQLTRQNARILMYHRISSLGPTAAASTAIFERQMAYVAANFKTRRLSQLVDRLHAGEPLDPLTVVITFDDGYCDFEELAYPILTRYEIPATVYVVSDFAAGGTWLWFDALRWIVQHARAASYALTLAGASVSVTFGDTRQCTVARELIADALMQMSPHVRRRAIEDLQEQLGVSLPAGPPPEYAAMGWDQLRRLDVGLVELGAHGRSHSILAHCSPEIQRDEIAGCKTAIEAGTGRKVTAFCYPNGMPEDINADSVSIVRASGFSSAVVAYGGLAERNIDPYCLPRLPAAPDFPQFRNSVNGLWSLRHSASAVGRSLY